MEWSRMDAIGEPRIFDDIHRFSRELVSTEGRYIKTGRSTTPWSIASAAVGGVMVQVVRLGGAAAFAGSGVAGKFTIAFPHPTTAEIQIDGRPLSADAFCLISQGRGISYCSPSPTTWVSVTIPTGSFKFTDHVIAKARNSLARSVAQSRDGGIARLSRIYELIKEVFEYQCQGRIGATTSALITEKLADEVLHCLSDIRADEALTHGRREHPREPILQTCLKVIGERGGHPLSLAELCDLVEVPERTLREVFYEYFGVGPMRLLKLRQLHEVNRSLWSSDASKSVSQLFLAIGICDFSRAAHQYRLLFGESPSQTRRRAMARDGSSNHAEDRAWLDVATQCFAATARRI
jgi:AraC family transcriptional regulator, ethanolamine operon transcriptional activator